MFETKYMFIYIYIWIKIFQRWKNVGKLNLLDIFGDNGVNFERKRSNLTWFHVVTELYGHGFAFDQ